MKEEIKDIMFIGLGLAVLTKEKVESLIKELKTKGMMNEKDARAFVEKISVVAEKKKADIEETIKKEINRIVKKVEKATRPPKKKS